MKTRALVNKILRILILTAVAIGLVLFCLGILARIFGWMDFRPSDESILNSIQSEDNLAFMDSLRWNGGRTSFASVRADDRDSAVAVFYVHGSPGSMEANLGFLNNPLLRGKFEQYTYDRIGYGGSLPLSAEGSLEVQADQLAALVIHANARKNYLVGHSLGCTIAAYLAMDKPELVDGLILVGAALDPALEPSSWWRPLLDLPVISVGIPNAFSVSNHELWPLKKELELCENKWKNIRCPVTFIQGTIDNLVPAANVEFGEKVMTNAMNMRKVMLDGKGHFIYWTEQDLIAREILRIASVNN